MEKHEVKKANQAELSYYGRRATLARMAEKELDLLVIGGGITGAGIALDSAARGMTVGLVEKQDFAAGTSSRSTKLIHGGLRYLKQGEIKLVQEVGRERAILYRNAPHIVIPEKMLLPLIKNGSYGKFATSIGLWVYDRLAGVVKDERRVMVSKEETMRLEPLLRKDVLVGGGLYIEYRTDDARLTVEVMKSAAQRGALCVNYAEATELLYDPNGKVIGAVVTDSRSGESYNVYARKIVNATGPWVDGLRERDKSLYGKRLHLTKGVHVVISHDRFPIKQSVYFDVPDGRMLFAIPRGNTTYVGTTDTEYKASIDKPVVTRQDVDYIIGAVNSMFPDLKLEAADIQSSWAGLRPLIHEDGKSPSELSRKDEIFVAPSGFISIAGGKLTGFRKMAERVVDLVARQLQDEQGRRFDGCTTDGIVLSGGDFGSAAAMDGFIADLAKRYGYLHVREEDVKSLVGKYGTNAKRIVEQATSRIAEGGEGEAADVQRLLLSAELRYCAEAEMICTLSDFLIRRSGRLLFEREKLADVYVSLHEELASLFGWTEEERAEQLRQFEEEYQAVVRFE